MVLVLVLMLAAYEYLLLLVTQLVLPNDGMGTKMRIKLGMRTRVKCALLGRYKVAKIMGHIAHYNIHI